MGTGGKGKNCKNTDRPASPEIHHHSLTPSSLSELLRRAADGLVQISIEYGPVRYDQHHLSLFPFRVRPASAYALGPGRSEAGNRHRLLRCVGLAVLITAVDDRITATIRLYLGLDPVTLIVFFG